MGVVMGANLVPIVRNFYINPSEVADQHSIEDGCITAGTHRVLRFDFLSHNIGDADLVVGAPADHPEWFVESASHGHFHLKDFNEFVLFDLNGNEVTAGYKQAFCLIDIQHPSPWGPANARFTDCNSNQGVSAGWADVYSSGLACQFIVIDGLPDGTYMLRSTTNKQHKIPEDTYADNTIYTYLEIVGDTVIETLSPWLYGKLHHYEEVVRILFGITNDGGGLAIGPNGEPIPIGPWDPLRGISPEVRTLVAATAIYRLASIIPDARVGDRFRSQASKLGAKAAKKAAATRG